MLLMPSSMHFSKYGRGGRVVELPAARAGVPLGGVELHALEPELLRVLLELREARVAVARVEAPVDDQPVRVLGSHDGVLLGRV
jgi:hypothetical protein